MGVLFDIEDGVARVTIDRPERMNALDDESSRELEAIWQRIEADRELRCVILTGAGDRAFSAGADMKAPNAMTGLEYWGHSNANGFGGIALRRTLDIPVIARVNGYALGGGFEMVLGCDILIAAEGAKFGLPEARVGRMPLDGGIVLLQRQVPEKIALGMLYTGRLIDAVEAASFGLVNEVVPYTGLDDAVGRWVAEIKACAPLSLKAIKQTVKRTAHLSAHEAQAQRLPAVIAALCSKDADEGVRAFREKRPPKWTGS